MSRTSKSCFLFFMLACISIFCALGTWQVKRLHWKENLIAELDKAYVAEPEEITPDQISDLKENQFLRGILKGRFYFSKAFMLMGQIDDGKQTSHSLVPFEISKDLTILVDMGPDFETPRDQIAEVSGLLKNAPKPNRFTPENIPDQNIWYRIDPNQLNIKNLKPFLVLPEHTPWKDYPATKPELRNNHLQYAIFWFTLALVIAGLTIFYLRKS